MKKVLFSILMLLALFVVPAAHAEYQYGIYTEDFQEIESGDFAYSSITHVRGNFYAVAYQGLNSDGYLRIIELDDNYNIINTNVDTWEFDTDLAEDITVINLDDSIGLSLIGYVANHNPSYKTAKVKSFRVFENGDISAGSTYSIFGTSLDLISSVDLTKTSDSTAMFTAFNYATYGFAETYGFTVGQDGTFTVDESAPRHCLNDASSISANQDINFIKDGSTCSIYYLTNSAKGYRASYSCSNTLVSGGTDTHNCLTPQGTQFEGNEVHNLDVEVDLTNHFSYLTYGETLDAYGVFTVLDSTTGALKDKLRFEDTTTGYNNVHTLSDNNALVTFKNSGGAMEMQSFNVDVNGNIAEKYNQNVYYTGAYFDVADIPGSFDKYITTYQSNSGEVRTMGVGIVPPPLPEDTQVNLKDERTLGLFNMTDKTLTFNAHCVNNIDYSTPINSTSQSIPVDCDYESFDIKIEYEVGGTNYAYKRYYLRDLEDTYNQFTLDAYLVDPFDTDYVENEFVIDDLTEVYKDAKLYFEKNINGNSTQITASEIDLSNSMRAILMNGETYYIYLESDDTGRNFLGSYLAPGAGISREATTLHLYDIDLTPNINKIAGNVDYQVYSDETDVFYIVKTPEGVTDNLINMTIEIFEGTVNSGTVIFSDTKGASEYSFDNLYGLFSDGPLDFSAYENSTISARLHFYFVDDGSVRQKVYDVNLWANNKLNLELLEYVEPEFMDWFILILLSVIAVFATVSTADVMAMVIIGLAAVFVMFGWFAVSSGTLGLAAIVALVNWLKKGSEEMR